jgi:hypothetical protein
MPTYKRKTMCDECPFRANAMRGWLGPLTVDDLEKTVHGPIPGIGDLGDMICHPEIKRLADRGLDQDEILEQGQMCVGMIRYANSVCKSARRPEMQAFQEAVSKVPDQPLIPPFKLREHHTPPARKQKRARVKRA